MKRSEASRADVASQGNRAPAIPPETESPGAVRFRQRMDAVVREVFGDLLDAAPPQRATVANAPAWWCWVVLDDRGRIRERDKTAAYHTRARALKALDALRRGGEKGTVRRAELRLVSPDTARTVRGRGADIGADAPPMLRGRARRRDRTPPGEGV